MSKFPARDIPESGPNDQRPPSSEDTIRPRRLRTRQAARHEASKEPTSQSGPSSSLNAESSRPHMGASRIRASAMSRSHQRQESFSLGPRLTKTGRISKARKGVKDAHICSQCGKVRVCLHGGFSLFSAIHRTSHLPSLAVVYSFIRPSSFRPAFVDLLSLAASSRPHLLGQHYSP
jgi:hypothetical protein